jgi:cell division protein FtsB
MSATLRWFGILVTFALVGVYAVVVLRGPQGLPALAEKRQMIRELQEQNATLMLQIRQKKERIQILKDNANAQEMEVRKEFKLQRPGETTFILPEPDAAPAKAPESTPESVPAQ